MFIITVLLNPLGLAIGHLALGRW